MNQRYLIIICWAAVFVRISSLGQPKIGGGIFYEGNMPFDVVVNRVFRGGGLGSFAGKKNPWKRLLSIVWPSAAVHEASLEELNKILLEQIENLQRQLRTLQEEARQLRNLLRSQSQTSRRGTADTVRLQLQSEQQLREELARLLEDIEQLTISKEKVEKMLHFEQMTVSQLEQALLLEKKKLDQMEQRAKAEMDQLRNTLIDQSKTQLKQLEAETIKTLNDERERLGKSLREERVRGEQALLDERKRGEEAIEKEREKMRKLVKAIAEKEKKAASDINKKTVVSDVATKDAIASNVRGISTSTTTKKGTFGTGFRSNAGLAKGKSEL